jgi:hypothetical protein
MSMNFSIPRSEPKPSLGDEVLTELAPGEVGHDRAVAVGDVAEGPDVHEARLALESLDQVRLQGVLQQDRHRPRTAHLLGGHGGAVDVVADGDRPDPPSQILERGRHAHDRHDLRRSDDVEARLARDAVRRAPEAGDDVAQVAVVHVDRAPPGDAVRIDAAVVAVEEVAVDERGQHVVGGRDGVEVAGEVQVQVLHRDDLGEPAARGPSLDAEDRPERRLAQAQDGPLADVPEPLGERHGRRRLALARLGGRDRRDADDLGVGRVGEAVDRPEADLGLVPPVQIDLVVFEAHLAGDVEDRPEGGFLGDLEA